MHHFIIGDSFKGSLTSEEVALAVQNGILQGDREATIDWSPGADGGEGTLEMLFANGFVQAEAETIDLAGRPIRAQYTRKNEQAIIEVARVCGLGQVRATDLPITLHTRGVGRLVLRGNRNFFDTRWDRDDGWRAWIFV